MGKLSQDLVNGSEIDPNKDLFYGIFDDESTDEEDVNESNGDKMGTEGTNEDESDKNSDKESDESTDKGNNDGDNGDSDNDATGTKDKTNDTGDNNTSDKGDNDKDADDGSKDETDSVIEEMDKATSDASDNIDKAKNIADDIKNTNSDDIDDLKSKVEMLSSALEEMEDSNIENEVLVQKLRKMLAKRDEEMDKIIEQSSGISDLKIHKPLIDKINGDGELYAIVKYYGDDGQIAKDRLKDIFISKLEGLTGFNIKNLLTEQSQSKAKSVVSDVKTEEPTYQSNTGDNDKSFDSKRSIF